jgi:hypothetical protein
MYPSILLTILPYVLICWLLAFFGRDLKFGFWGNFWVSIILTPLAGIIVILAQDKKIEKKS